MIRPAKELREIFESTSISSTESIKKEVHNTIKTWIRSMRIEKEAVNTLLIPTLSTYCFIGSNTNFRLVNRNILISYSSSEIIKEALKEYTREDLMRLDSCKRDGYYIGFNVTSICPNDFLDEELRDLAYEVLRPYTINYITKNLDKIAEQRKSRTLSICRYKDYQLDPTILNQLLDNEYVVKHTEDRINRSIIQISY